MAVVVCWDFSIPLNHQGASHPNTSATSPALGQRRASPLSTLRTMIQIGWWTMEFVLLDIGATLVLLLAYLAVVIRNAVV